MKTCSLVIFCFLIPFTLLSQTNDTNINKIIDRYQEDFQSAKSILEIQNMDLEATDKSKYILSYLSMFADDLLQKEALDESTTIFEYIKSTVIKLGDPQYDQFVFVGFNQQLSFYIKEKQFEKAKETLSSSISFIENSKLSNKDEFLRILNYYELSIKSEQEKQLERERRKKRRIAKKAKKESERQVDSEKLAKLMEVSSRMTSALQGNRSIKINLESELNLDQYKASLLQDVSQSHLQMDEFNKRLINLINDLSYSEANHIISDLSDLISFHINFVQKNHKDNTKISSSLFNQVSSLNDAVNKHRIGLRNALKKADDSIREMWESRCGDSLMDDFFDFNFISPEIYNAPMDSDTSEIDLTSYYKYIEQIEVVSKCKELEEKVKQDFPYSPLNEYSYAHVKNELREDEAIIVFRRYIGDDGLANYGALVAKTDFESPKWVMIENSSILEGDGYLSYLESLKKKEDNIAFELYFSQVDSLLEDCNRVFVVSDGIYHKVNLTTLYDSYSEKFILDKYDVVYLRDFQRLNDTKTSLKEDDNVSLVGVTKFLQESKNVNLKRFKFSDLPYVNEEVQSISNLFSSQFNVDISIDKPQIIERIKSYDNPDVVHFSTHGYYLPRNIIQGVNESEKNLIVQEYNDTIISFREKFETEEGKYDVEKAMYWYEKFNPFLQSGLVLDRGDYLSSKTISLLNLKETKLVTLSACHGNSGLLLSGQSTMGVKNSFLMSGAEYVLASTHMVGDFETLEFMKYFYGKLANGNTIQESYTSAVNYIKSEHPIIAPSLPFIWGAFTLERGYLD